MADPAPEPNGAAEMSHTPTGSTGSSGSSGGMRRHPLGSLSDLQLAMPCAGGINATFAAPSASGTDPQHPQLAFENLTRSANAKLVLVMVGLPARGKTFIGRSVKKYLSWLGVHCRVFNVGNYRREVLGPYQDASFFDPHNAEAQAKRRMLSLRALEDMFNYLDGGGHVAIFDATNSTVERRTLIRTKCFEHCIDPIFIESVCNDPAIIEDNIRETKLSMPDYASLDPEAAVRDFKERIRNYELAYETITDNSLSYIKLIDVGQQVILNRIQGYLPGRIVFLLMNLHTKPRTIWLSRHGESEFNASGRIGGDPPLSANGRAYARKLGEFIRKRKAEIIPESGSPPLSVWTSSLTRTVETSIVAGFAPADDFVVTQWKSLDEIDAGDCEGMTYEEIAEKYPHEFEARMRDKLRYRYPRGESYEDVIIRIEPIITEIERRRDRGILVIAHQAVLRALYGYLAERTMNEVPHLDIPLHTVIELTPKAYGCEERRFVLDFEPATDI